MKVQVYVLNNYAASKVYNINPLSHIEHTHYNIIALSLTACISFLFIVSLSQ